ncbi:zinc metalloprotease [Streptosporangium sp. NBC_01755]|uniref:zinc metalloprotease n=1 Tax=unclassified Streptosporangium TaxID=2632669 RepID=UPI002DDA515A|nr:MULTISPECIES: zinc metalloprotease [unclassified Streptosporangium]WSA23879.1 zinc metalloprotease [Streptosporangium sp. NBC_01810]WSC98046.1 zinc metalloprotease [Streptosporangium sp. NBC_01755]
MTAPTPGREPAAPGCVLASRAAHVMVRGAARPVPSPEPSPVPFAHVPVDGGSRSRPLPLVLPITVPTWVHVITDGRLGASDAAVRDQVATLNAAYSGRLGGADTGIRFRLEGITRTVNATWFRAPVTHERSIKQMRRGGPETLNLYLAQLSELVLGYSTYPHGYRKAPALDGVVVDWRSLPGGAMRSFDKGFTGVHEIGHWLGLLHTFEKGCEAAGDGVADTSPEGQPTEGCPLVKDTCEGGGPDPIHNFMDYSDDRCMSGFTPGQALRMQEMWVVHRDAGRTLPLTGDSTEGT